MSVNCRVCGCIIDDIAEDDEIHVIMDGLNICDDCIDDELCETPMLEEFNHEKATKQ